MLMTSYLLVSPLATIHVNYDSFSTRTECFCVLLEQRTINKCEHEFELTELEQNRARMFTHKSGLVREMATREHWRCAFAVSNWFEISNFNKLFEHLERIFYLFGFGFNLAFLCDGSQLKSFGLKCPNRQFENVKILRKMCSKSADFEFCQK